MLNAYQYNKAIQIKMPRLAEEALSCSGRHDSQSQCTFIMPLLCFSLLVVVSIVYLYNGAFCNFVVNYHYFVCFFPLT